MLFPAHIPEPLSNINVIFHKMMLKIDVIRDDFSFRFLYFSKRCQTTKVTPLYDKMASQNKCSVFETAYTVIAYTRLSRISTLEKNILLLQNNDFHPKITYKYLLLCPAS